MSIPLHERLEFDTANGQVLDQSRRYLLMRADVLMGLFRFLPPPVREQALHALGQSVAQFGADSVRAYAAQPGADAQALLGIMQDAAASLGWGRWHFEATPDRLHLTVQNSPFAAAAGVCGGCTCHAITGMLEALALTRWPAGVQAGELVCAAQPNAGPCQFEARPAASGASAPDPLSLHPLPVA